jgi:hypothetical protein
MKFHVNGSAPKTNEIFVFGSNLGGQHLGGAAKAAFSYYGAAWFVAVGATGNSYAIPTVNATVSGSLPINVIAAYVKQFIDYATLRRDQTFFVTAIGCGIAGFTHAEIAPLFSGAPDNCDFPEEWKPFLV